MQVWVPVWMCSPLLKVPARHSGQTLLKAITKGSETHLRISYVLPSANPAWESPSISVLSKPFVSSRKCNKNSWACSSRSTWHWCNYDQIKLHWPQAGLTYQKTELQANQGKLSYQVVFNRLTVNSSQGRRFWWDARCIWKNASYNKWQGFITSSQAAEEARVHNPLPYNTLISHCTFH